MSQFQLARDEAIHTNGAVTVHRGRMLPQQIPVAIKEKRHSTLAEGNASLREGICLRELPHPNICRVYEYFVEGSPGGVVKTVLVLERLDHDLAREVEQRRSENRPWTEQQLTTILQGLLSALSFAEARRISHRNLQPQNILWDSVGKVVKLADFGSATVLREAGFKYPLQDLSLYMSPELKQGYFQASGDRTLSYDPIKSDVYSLGLVMLHLATLSPPEQLWDPQNLDKTTEMLIAQVPPYPALKFMLEVSLAAAPSARPSFLQLAEWMIEPNSQPQVPAAPPVLPAAPPVIPAAPPVLPAVIPVAPPIEFRPLNLQQDIPPPPSKPIRGIAKVEREIRRVKGQAKRLFKTLRF